MRGRKPKPRNLKIVEGTFRKDRDKNEPQPERVAPSCPRWLPVEAKKEWRRLAGELESLGLLTELDRAVFAAYCVLISRWQAAEALIAKEGLVFVGPDGRKKPHPATRVASQSLQLMLKFAGDFGLTPSSRSRIHLPAPQRRSLRQQLEGDDERFFKRPQPAPRSQENEPS